jgi:dynactin complex subunit
MASATQNWSLGERVRDEGGHVATVRYIGNVASAKDQSALYIGVEWDDPTRGKHDGSAIRSEDGVKVQHFTCTEGAGSFLKPKKLIRGETFGNVMRRRYVQMHEEMVSKDNKLDMEQAHVKTWNGRALPIELYGELKIRKQQQLVIFIDIPVFTKLIEPTDFIGRFGSSYMSR